MKLILIGLIASGAGPALAREQRPAIEGEALTDELRDFIAGQVQKREAPASALAARRQAREAGRVAREALNARGYFAPRIETAVLEGPPLRPVLRIDPGRRFTIARIDLSWQGDAPDEDTARRARDAIPVEPGDAAIPERVLKARAAISQLLQERSHAFANVQGQEVVGDREAGTLDVTYLVEAGPRVAFGEVRYPDTTRTRRSYLEKLVPFHSGESYTPGKLAELNSRLSRTRLFRVARASLESEASGRTGDGPEIHDVRLELEDRPRNTIALGASFATDRGAGFDALYTRRNLIGAGDFLTAKLTVAQLERIFDLEWNRPNRFGYGRAMVWRARLDQEETDAFDRRSVELGGYLENTRNPRFTYSLGADVAVVRETARLDLRSDRAEERDLQLVTFRGGAQLDRADSALDPREGWRADLSVEPTVGFGEARSQFIRSTAQLRAYLPVDDDKRTVLAGRVRLGTAFGAQIADLPTDRRFFAGGGGSVRGYGYQAIGPRTPDGTPLGGRSLAEVSGEVRHMIRDKVELVAFLDAGTVTEDETFGFENVRPGAGIGARYHTTAGPIRVDIGVPLDKSRFDDPFQVYLSIGQSF
ncbi:MAG: BamA/TamA family outer membrane protein [Alphaproteobacteria bacterium]|jgi:translocation and assembly module TamA|nr:BamA/TamA family outer membrane protein [Alphaproteobacteria bacterium]